MLLLIDELAQARQASISWGFATGFGGLLISLIAIYIMLGRMVRLPLEKVNAMMIEMAKGLALWPKRYVTLPEDRLKLPVKQQN